MIAQGIAGIPILSGEELRWLMWLFFTSLGIIYSLWYANRIKKNPRKSLSYDSDVYFRKDISASIHENVRFKFGHLLIIISLFASLGWIIWGALRAGYFIPQLATIFFILGVVSGIIGVMFKLNNMTIKTNNG